MRFRVVALLAGSAVLALSAGGALAVTDNLDQHQDTHDSAGFDAADYATAQTFTANVSGQLSRVSLYGTPVNIGDSTLTVKIESVDGSGHPTGTVLTGATTTATPVSGWFDASFSPGPDIAAQTKYAIVFGNAGYFMAAGNCTEAYTRGEALATDNSVWAPLVDLGPNSCIVDFAFRTYVVSGAAPSAPACATAAPTASSTPLPDLVSGAGGQPAADPAALPLCTPPPTDTVSGGSSHASTPLLALVICLGFGGLGLAAVETQRWRVHR